LKIINIFSLQKNLKKNQKKQKKIEKPNLPVHLKKLLTSLQIFHFLKFFSKKNLGSFIQKSKIFHSFVLFSISFLPFLLTFLIVKIASEFLRKMDIKIITNYK